MAEKWSKLAMRRFFGRFASLGGATAEVAVEEEKPAEEMEEGSQRVSGVRFYLSQIWRDKLAFVGLVITGAFLIWAFIEGIMQQVASLTGNNAYGYALLPSNPVLSGPIIFANKLLPPSLNFNFLFGSDNNGMSILSQILYAAPHDAEAAILVVGLGITVGMFVGIAAGYFGSWVDEVLMRLTDAFLALPGLVLAIAIIVLMGNNFFALLIALIIVWWPTYARFFRSEALTLKNRSFVEAAKLSGVSTKRILFRHIFPNAIDPVIAYATLDFGTVILTLSVLAFLGIGLQVNYPEWGAMASFGLGQLQTAWWWPIIPGLVILMVVVGFTLLGDKLQDLVGGRTSY